MTAAQWDSCSVTYQPAGSSENVFCFIGTFCRILRNVQIMQTQPWVTATERQIRASPSVLVLWCFLWFWRIKSLLKKRYCFLLVSTINVTTSAGLSLPCLCSLWNWFTGWRKAVVYAQVLFFPHQCLCRDSVTPSPTQRPNLEQTLFFAGHLQSGKPHASLNLSPPLIQNSLPSCCHQLRLGLWLGGPLCGIPAVWLPDEF